LIIGVKHQNHFEKYRLFHLIEVLLPFMDIRFTKMSLFVNLLVLHHLDLKVHRNQFEDIYLLFV